MRIEVLSQQVSGLKREADQLTQDIQLAERTCQQHALTIAESKYEQDCLAWRITVFLFNCLYSEDIM